MRVEANVAKMKAADESTIREMMQCLALEKTQPFTLINFTAFVKDCKYKTHITKTIREQIRLLITYYGKKRQELMIFKGLDNDAMVLAFKGVLQRVENGDLDPIKR